MYRIDFTYPYYFRQLQELDQQKQGVTMRTQTKLLFILNLLAIGALALTLSACGGAEPLGSSGVAPSPSPHYDEVHVQSRIVVNVQSEQGRTRGAVQDTSQSITIVNNAVSTSGLAAFSQPPAQTATSATVNIDLGSITVSSLFDNDLKHCGNGGTHHCGNAGFRIYNQTKNGLGDGNADLETILPLLAKPVLTALSTFGIGAENSLVLQTITIPGSKNTVRLTDFTPTPSYDLQADFSNAGAGTFTGTIILEYYIY